MRLVFFIALLSLPAVLAAQTIRGVVQEALTEETIIGATVVLKGQQTKGAVTGLDGSFSISNVGAFPATLTISFIGYKSQDMVVESSSPIVVKLEEDQLFLNEVVIIGENSGRTDNSARAIEKMSMNVLNVVSARAIEISPDMTVGNVISRVSGVTVERNSSGEGQYAILRGMDKRFNYTLVNGVKIPSPDNKNRFVPLDIFPSELLDRLEVTKALTADMEGDGIGGAVNMVMKDAPAKHQFTANISTGYNTQFFDRNYQSFGYQSVVRQSPSERYGLEYPVQMKDFSHENLHLRSGRAAPNLTGGFSWGSRMFQNKIGLMLAGSYSNTYRGNNSDMYSSTIETDGSQTMTKRNFSNQQTRIGTHAKVDIALAPEHKIVWYNAYMDFRTAQVREAFSQKSHTIRMRWNHQTIFNSTLKGVHNLAGQALTLDWSLNYGHAFNETPDNVLVNANIINDFVAIDQNAGATRRWEHNSDKDKTALLNLQYTAKIGETALNTAIGGMYRNKARDSYFNEYIFKPYNPDKENPRELIRGMDWNNFDELTFQVNPYGNLSDPLNYDATERISSGYLTAKLTRNRIQFIAGVRAEHTRQGYHLKFTTEGAQNTGEQTYMDYLPNFHVKYNMQDNTNLRLSYVKAINRPSFFEIVPYNIINEEYKERGNPDLKRTVAQNFDLRYEFFPRPSEQFMAGVFYKKINDPIEFGFVPGYGQDTYYMPVNYGEAYNLGVELDAIKYFNWFGVKANYTFTQSNITTTKKKVIPNPDPDAETNTLIEYVNQTRPLYGQAAHVANVSLLLHSPGSGWDAQIAFSYTGQRLVIVSQWLDDDTWQGGFVQMDVSVDKRFKNGVTLFCKASNLLNTPMIQYVRLNSMNEKYDPRVAMYNGGIVDRKERYWQNIAVGMKYKF